MSDVLFGHNTHGMSTHTDAQIALYFHTSPSPLIMLLMT